MKMRANRRRAGLLSARRDCEFLAALREIDRAAQGLIGAVHAITGYARGLYDAVQREAAPVGLQAVV